MDTMYFAFLQDPHPVEYNKNLELPQFRLMDILLVDCSKNYTTGFVQLSLSLSLLIILVVVPNTTNIVPMYALLSP